MADELQVERRGRVLVVTIDRQERMNALYLARHGAAVLAPTPRAVATAVARCVEQPEHLMQLRDAARAVSHPHAAREIASLAVTLTQSIVHSP